MIKQLMVAVLAAFSFAAFAAVDANKASQAELEAVKGIGPGIAGKIVEERKKGNFKDWNDMVTRVNGIGDGNAAKFSAAGMTVGGAPFAGAAPAAPAAKKEDKPAAKAAPADAKKETKPMAAAAPAAPATPAAPAAAAKPAAAAVPATPAAPAKPAAAAEKKPEAKAAAASAPKK